MNRKLILYTYSSDWKIEDYGGVGDGANPNMPHTFQVKESKNMLKFMPGDEFEIDRDNYPNGIYEKITERGYNLQNSKDSFSIVLVNPKGKYE